MVNGLLKFNLMYVRTRKTNKQFKSDSARLAFLVWIEFSVYGGQIMCRGRVLHTLIGRYATYLIMGLKLGSLDHHLP